MRDLHTGFLQQQAFGWFNRIDSTPKQFLCQRNPVEFAIGSEQRESEASFPMRSTVARSTTTAGLGKDRQHVVIK